MKAFLFKLSPGAFAGYGRVIAPLIVHSRAIAALAGVLGGCNKTLQSGLVFRNPFDCVFNYV